MLLLAVGPLCISISISVPVVPSGLLTSQSSPPPSDMILLSARIEHIFPYGCFLLVLYLVDWPAGACLSESSVALNYFLWSLSSGPESFQPIFGKDVSERQTRLSVYVLPACILHSASMYWKVTEASLHGLLSAVVDPWWYECDQQQT